jgi:hypothetical protein
MSGYILPSNPFSGGGGEIEPAAFMAPPLTDTYNEAASGPNFTGVTSGGVAHNPGAWVELTASLSADSSGILVQVNAFNTSTLDSSTIMEIGVGAASSEVVWGQVLCGFLQANMILTFPGFIAAGSRVAVRIRSIQPTKNVTSNTFRFLGASSIITAAPTMYGINTAASRGVVLTAPGAINTESEWTEITAATTSEHNVIGATYQLASGTVLSTGALFDIGIGAAGFETVLVPNMYANCATTESFNMPVPNCFGVNIPVGSRLSARYRTTLVATAFNLALICA